MYQNLDEYTLGYRDTTQENEPEKGGNYYGTQNSNQSFHTRPDESYYQTDKIGVPARG